MHGLFIVVASTAVKLNCEETSNFTFPSYRRDSISAGTDDPRHFRVTAWEKSAPASTNDGSGSCYQAKDRVRPMARPNHIRTFGRRLEAKKYLIQETFVLLTSKCGGPLSLGIRDRNEPTLVCRQSMTDMSNPGRSWSSTAHHGTISLPWYQQKQGGKTSLNRKRKLSEVISALKMVC